MDKAGGELINFKAKADYRRPIVNRSQAFDEPLNFQRIGFYRLLIGDC
jgi:hypothetical protein